MGLEKERALTMQEIKNHKGEDVKSLYIYIMLKQNEDNGGREIVKIWRTEREKKGGSWVSFIFYYTSVIGVVKSTSRIRIHPVIENSYYIQQDIKGQIY